MGIMDPTKVTRTALQNAASVAGLMITTECMIAELPKKDEVLLAAAWWYGRHGRYGWHGRHDVSCFCFLVYIKAPPRGAFFLVLTGLKMTSKVGSSQSLNSLF